MWDKQKKERGVGREKEREEEGKIVREEERHRDRDIVDGFFLSLLSPCFPVITLPTGCPCNVSHHN